MLERMQQDVEIFRREGRLTEQEYNDAVIPALDNPEGMPWDEKAIHNQRATLVTNPAVVARRQNKLNSNLELGNALTSGDLTKDQDWYFEK